MPINLTFPNSVKMSIQVFIIKILVFTSTLAASRLFQSLDFFTWDVGWSHKKHKIELL